MKIRTALAATGLAAAALLGGAGAATADAGAQGAATGSPGVLSGNNTQLPISIPVNVCGTSVSAAGALSPVFGLACVND